MYLSNKLIISLTRHFECEFAVATDLGQRHGLAPPLDLLALTVASLTGDLDGKRRTVYVVVGELQVHDVVTRFGGAVRDVQCAVFVVLALDLRFAGALDGKRQPPVTCAGHRSNYQQNSSRLGRLIQFFNQVKSS